MVSLSAFSLLSDRISTASFRSFNIFLTKRISSFISSHILFKRAVFSTSSFFCLFSHDSSSSSLLTVVSRNCNLDSIISFCCRSFFTVWAFSFNLEPCFLQELNSVFISTGRKKKWQRFIFFYTHVTTTDRVVQWPITVYRVFNTSFTNVFIYLLNHSPVSSTLITNYHPLEPTMILVVRKLLHHS